MENNVQIVQDAYNKFASGDIAGLLGNCAEDIDWETPEVENSTFGGKCRGHAAVGQFFAGMDAAQEITKFEPAEFIAQGDRVVVLGTFAANVKETGRNYESDWVHVFTVKDGKITNFSEFFDNAAATRAYQKVTTA